MPEVQVESRACCITYFRFAARMHKSEIAAQSVCPFAFKCLYLQSAINKRFVKFTFYMRKSCVEWIFLARRLSGGPLLCEVGFYKSLHSIRPDRVCWENNSESPA